MSTPNPFMITPAGNMSEGLSGLSDVLKEVGEERRQREEQEAATQAIQGALQSGDLNEIHKVAAQYPSMANMLYKGMGATQNQQKARTLSRVRQLVSAPPEQRTQVLQRLIQEGESQGLPMTESKRELEFLQQNPEEFDDYLKRMYAGVAPEQEFKAWQESRKPRETRERKVGEEIVTEEFRPDTGKWEEISRAPRFDEGEVLEERLIAQLPEEQQRPATMALLNKKLSTSQSEFERITDDLVSRGVITQNEADRLSAQKLATDATGEQSRITLDTENNTLTIEEGRDLGENPITANKIDDLTAQRDYLDRGIDMLEGVLKDPQRLGAVASIARMVRTGKEVSTDLASTFPGAGRVIDGATNLIETAVNPDDRTEVDKLFSDKLDELSLLENSLGLLLARTRIPDNRVPVEVIKRSIKDVGLTGLTSDEQVRNRLQNVFGQLRQSRDDINNRIPGNQRSGGNVMRFDDQGNLINE